MRILLMIILLCPGVIAWYIEGKTDIDSVKALIYAGIKCIVNDIIIAGAMWLMNRFWYNTNRISLSIHCNEGRYNIFNADFVKDYMLEAIIVALLLGLMEKFLLKKLKKNNKGISVAIFLICGIFLTACTFERNGSVINTCTDAPIEVDITRLDSTVEFENEPIEITLSGDCSEYIISSGGEYHLSGKLTGQLVIDTSDEIVHLLLDNAEIKATQGPAIFVKSAGKVIITLADGTENTIEDANNYKGFEEETACLYANCPITINGGGTLFVYAFCEDGIKCKEQIKVLDSTVKLKAKGCGIKSSKSVVLLPSVLSVECEGSGIKAVKNEESFIYIGSGQVSVTAGKYGVNTAGTYKYENSIPHITGVLGDVQAKTVAGEENANG